MLGRDETDPLFLQLKEAQASVLEPFLGKSTFNHHGQRVVEGQRLTQAASDIMLGWIRIEDFDGVSRDFYVRQLWDGKGSAARRDDERAGDDLVRASCAGTRSRRRTRAPGTRSRSPATSAPATASTARWRRSPRPTPTRTNATTTPCRRQSRPAGSRPRQACDGPAAPLDAARPGPPIETSLTPARSCRRVDLALELLGVSLLADHRRIPTAAAPVPMTSSSRRLRSVLEPRSPNPPAQASSSLG